MIVIVDSKRRVRLPRPVKPGDVFELETVGEWGFILKRLGHPGRKVKLSRKEGLLIASTGRKITMKQTLALMAQFP